MSQVFDRPWLILCEGNTDKQFLHRLIARRNIDDRFHIRFPDRAGEKTGGRSKFGTALAIYRAAETFRQSVKAVLIISDNDEDPAASFKEIQQKIKDDSDGFPVPQEDRKPVKKNDYPIVTTLMIPAGKPGCLEDLCVAAAYNKWGIKAAVDQFNASTPSKDWTANRQAKMRLQSIFAATCEERPDGGFAAHWDEDAKYHLPVTDPAFDDIAAFLANFAAHVADA